MRYAGPYGDAANAPYVNGNPATGVRGSIPPAEAFENPQREMVNFIESAGLTPSQSDLFQMWKAAQRAPWITSYGVDTGTANHLVAIIAPSITALIPGTQLHIKALNDNSGATDVTITGLGTYNVKRANGAALQSGDIKANQVVDLSWDGTNFQMTNYLGTGGVGDVNNYVLEIPFAVSAGTGNALTGPFSPAITSLAAGKVIQVQANATNSGNVSITVNALSSKTIKFPNGDQLPAGTIVSGAMLLLQYDGTGFQLVGNTSPRKVTIPYVAAGGTASAITATYSPAYFTPTAGDLLSVKLASGITGATTFNPNGLGAAALVGPDGSALTAGYALANDLLLLEYDGTAYRIISKTSAPAPVSYVSPPAVGSYSVVDGLYDGGEVIGAARVFGGSVMGSWRAVTVCSDAKSLVFRIA